MHVTPQTTHKNQMAKGHLERNQNCQSLTLFGMAHFITDCQL